MAAPWLAGIHTLFAIPAGLAALPVALPLFRWARGELRRIAWQSDGRWVLVDANGRSHEHARLLPGIFIGSAMLVLRWRCDSCGGMFHAALMKDNCETDARRRLCVRLRISADAELFPADQPRAGSGQ